MAILKSKKIKAEITYHSVNNLNEIEYLFRIVYCKDKKILKNFRQDAASGFVINFGSERDELIQLLVAIKKQNESGTIGNQEMQMSVESFLDFADRTTSILKQRYTGEELESRQWKKYFFVTEYMPTTFTISFGKKYVFNDENFHLSIPSTYKEMTDFAEQIFAEHLAFGGTVKQIRQNRFN